MGAEQSKPATAGDVQLLRLHYDDKEYVTAAAETFETLDIAIRRLVTIPKDRRIIISAKLECYQWKETTIDPDLWPALRPQVREIWVRVESGGPNHTKSTLDSASLRAPTEPELRHVPQSDGLSLSSSFYILIRVMRDLRASTGRGSHDISVIGNKLLEYDPQSYSRAKGSLRRYLESAETAGIIKMTSKGTTYFAQLSI
ncbi:hypothetical protein FS842_001934 [Serendipita sp. 407]|nr:hypothetical protein FS842_001934 [Serendipita sp. 407]